MCLLILSLLISVVTLVGAQPNASVTASEIPQQDGVLVLTDHTFAVAARAFDPLFVLFDSSSRYGSLTLQRRFTDAAQSVRRYDTEVVRFASLDVSQLTHTLPHDLKVLGLPALLLFHCQSSWPTTTIDDNINAMLANCAATPGGVDVYTGGRTSMELQRFALGEPFREVLQVDSKTELDGIVAARPFVALFIVDGDDSQAFIDCRVLAQIDADTSTYVVTTNELILDATTDTDFQVPSLVLFREFGRERVVYEGTWNKAVLLQFIQKNRYNLVSTYSDSDASYFYDRAAVGHVVLFSDPNDSYHAQLVQQVQYVALDYYVADKNGGGHVLRFLIVHKNHTTLTNALFVLEDQFPTVLVISNISQAPARMPFVGNATVALIENGSIAHAIGDELEKIFPPFATDDLPDDDVVSEEFIDWRDYSDLFTNRRTPFIIRVSTPVYPSSQGSGVSSSSAQFGVMDIDTEKNPTTAWTDPFLSIFLSPSSGTSSASRIVDIVSFPQLQALLGQQSPNGLVLVMLHSPRCYSCRQAMDTLATLPPSISIDALAVVNVDSVDVRAWPLRFQWLPGVFLFEGTTQVAAFPSRTAVTLDALASFLDRSSADLLASQML